MLICMVNFMVRSGGTYTFYIGLSLKGDGEGTQLHLLPLLTETACIKGDLTVTSSSNLKGWNNRY